MKLTISRFIAKVLYGREDTAKPQGDDIVRSKTVAKITSTNISHTYPDGSYAVPCVVMAS